MPVKKKNNMNRKWLFFKSIYMKQRVVLYIFQQIQRSRKREFNADHIIYDKKN